MSLRLLGSLVVSFMAAVRSHSWVWIGALGLLFASGREAHASGPVEGFAELAFDPAQPDHFVLLYSNRGTRRGLLYSTDAGKSWSLACADAVWARVMADGMHQNADPVLLKSELRRMGPLAVGAGGTLFMATASGLFADAAQGCGYREEPAFRGVRVTNLLHHPTEPEVLFALVGFEGEQQGVWQRNALGAWQHIGTRDTVSSKDERLVLKSMLVAPSDAGVRFYQVVWRYDLAKNQGRSTLRVSDDGAVTWTEHALADEREELQLLAVDPTQRQRLVAVIRRSSNMRNWLSERDTLLVSEDAGASFREYFDVAELGAVAFLPDGSLWIADAGAFIENQDRAGLYVAAPGLAAAPERRSELPYQCLAYHAASDTLYACQNIALGTLDRTSGQLSVLVQTTTVGDAIACEDRDVIADCKEQLCDNGYCALGHFPSAPLCIAYDEPFCGRRALGEVSGDPGRGTEGSEAEAPPRREPNPEDDAHDPGAIIINPPPEPKETKGGCALSSAPHAHLRASFLAGVGCALVILAWRRRRRVV